MWRRIPIVPMLFGACAAVALLAMLASRDRELSDLAIYAAVAAFGAAFMLLVQLGAAFFPHGPQSTLGSIGCGCASAGAAFFFLVPIAAVTVLVTGRGINFVGIPEALTTIAAYAGVGVLGGIMVARYRRAEQERQKAALETQAAAFARDQLELARDLQQRLLPPPSVESEHYRIHARNVPAAYVAGDFYDFVPLASGALLIVLADVAGKGVAAGLIMATVKAIIPLLAVEQQNAAPLLGQINERLSGQLPQREFVALLLAIYQPNQGMLTLANAGLPDPLFLPSAGSLRPIVVSGPRYPIGIRGRLNYESLTVKLAASDRILFFTDGLPEASIVGEPLGYERLSTEVQRSRGEVDVLFESLEKLGAAHDDDWTAIMFERVD
jgi:hypothetical protein